MFQNIERIIKTDMCHDLAYIRFMYIVVNLPAFF